MMTGTTLAGAAMAVKEQAAVQECCFLRAKALTVLRTGKVYADVFVTETSNRSDKPQ